MKTINTTFLKSALLILALSLAGAISATAAAPVHNAKTHPTLTTGGTAVSSMSVSGSASVEGANIVTVTPKVRVLNASTRKNTSSSLKKATSRLPVSNGLSKNESQSPVTLTINPGTRITVDGSSVKGFAVSSIPSGSTVTARYVTASGVNYAEFLSIRTGKVSGNRAVGGFHQKTKS